MRSVSGWLERHARAVGLSSGSPYTHAWLLRYYLYRYGHSTAYVILGLACFIALAIVVSVSSQQNDTSQALGTLVKNIQVDRRNTTGSICAAQNRVTRRLRQLIVQGARQSRPFEKLYRQYGGPPYRVRLRNAQADAASLSYVPCAEFVRRIEKLTPPPPNLP